MPITILDPLDGPAGMETAVGALAALDELDSPAVALDDEWVPVRVLTKRHSERRVFVVARERDGERLFRIRTEWMDGWLDPVVDVADTSADDGGFRPDGPLQGVGSAAWTARVHRPAPARPVKR